jgi:hypothetical protein
MQPSTSVAPETPGGQMSELGRITGIFWEPKPVYENLVARPRWWVPLILTTLLAIVFVFAFSHIVGWDTFMAQEMAKNSRTQDMPEAQRQEIAAMQSRFVGIFSYFGAVLGTAGVLLIVAGSLLFLFKTASGGETTSRQTFSIVCYSWLPFGLYQVLSLVALYFTNPADFDMRNPLPFNIGWFLDPSSSSAWLVALMSSIDIFSFWVMALLALGFTVVVKRMKFGKAFSMVFGAWFVFVLVKSGWVSLFS